MCSYDTYVDDKWPLHCYNFTLYLHCKNKDAS